MHLAVATAPGSAHVNPGQPGKTNNQDAIVHRTTSNGCSITVLCDGCGSQPHSGTGADIGANIIAQVLERHIAAMPRGRLDWEWVTQEAKKALYEAAAIFTPRNATLSTFEQTVVERFLFTAMVLIVDGDLATVAAFGDGIVVVDDDVIVVEPPVLNSPPYLGYLLLTETAYHTDELRQHLAFTVVKSVALSSLEKGIVVGTDGLKDLVGEDLHHPSLVQPKSLQRWLNAQTTERIASGTFVAGRCSDDVSLVIVRTEEAQDRLFESRRETAVLKQRASQLEAQAVAITEDLNRESLARSTAETRVSALEDSLKELTAKAGRAAALERAITDLDRDVSQLRKRVGRVKGPLSSAIERFLGTIRGSGAPNGVPGASGGISVPVRSFPEDPTHRPYARYPKGR